MPLLFSLTALLIGIVWVLSAITTCLFRGVRCCHRRRFMRLRCHSGFSGWCRFFDSRCRFLPPASPPLVRRRLLAGSASLDAFGFAGGEPVRRGAGGASVRMTVKWLVRFRIL